MFKKTLIILGVGGGLVVTGVLLGKAFNAMLSRRDDQQARRMYALLRHDMGSSPANPGASTMLRDNITVAKVAADRIRQAQARRFAAAQAPKKK